MFLTMLIYVIKLIEDGFTNKIYFVTQKKNHLKVTNSLETDPNVHFVL